MGAECLHKRYEASTSQVVQPAAEWEACEEQDSELVLSRRRDVIDKMVSGRGASGQAAWAVGTAAGIESRSQVLTAVVESPVQTRMRIPYCWCCYLNVGAPPRLRHSDLASSTDRTAHRQQLSPRHTRNHPRVCHPDASCEHRDEYEPGILAPR